MRRSHACHSSEVSMIDIDFSDLHLKMMNSVLDGTDLETNGHNQYAI